MRPVGWTKAVASILAPAMGNDKAVIRDQVLTGQARLLKFGDLYVVARHEGTTLVYVAVAGRGLRQNLPALFNYAVGSGAATIRFHTKRPDVLLPKLAGWPVRLVERRNRWFGRDEHVYEVTT